MIPEETQRWTRNPPAQLGHFWWWDEEDDHHPIVLNVCMELHGKLYATGDPFADKGDVTELDGLWMFLPTPAPPDKSQIPPV